MTTTTEVKNPSVLIDDAGKEAKRQKGWRIRASLVAYIERRGEGAGKGGEADFVEDAISIHKELYESLTEQEKKVLRRFAEEGGFDASRDSAKIVANLVRLGLESYDRRKR